MLLLTNFVPANFCIKIIYTTCHVQLSQYEYINIGNTLCSDTSIQFSCPAGMCQAHSCWTTEQRTIKETTPMQTLPRQEIPNPLAVEP